MLRIVAGIASVICDGLRWLWLTLRSTSAVEAENLFLRRQLALYVERGVKPRRIDSITRIALAVLSGFFDWRDALVSVRPQTLIRWHRAGWKLFWRLKSRPGRPPIPAELQALILRVAKENPSWGQERIANELLLKLGIRVSPRTVSKYLPRPSRGRPRGDLRWSTFLLSLIHISEPTRLGMISYAVFCLKKKNKTKNIVRVDNKIRAGKHEVKMKARE